MDTMKALRIISISRKAITGSATLKSVTSDYKRRLLKVKYFIAEIKGIIKAAFTKGRRARASIA